MVEQAVLVSRREELRRRVDQLPKEVDDWKARSAQELDFNAHYSQVEAIGVLMEAHVERLRALLKQLDAQGDPEAFRATAFALIQEIIKSQRVWDFFRDKLELRFSPDYKDPLWIADTVAWDCHRPILDRAADKGIVKKAEMREPPLTYLTAEFSPATWVRGSRPNDGRDYFLGTAHLPIPVIELPWDHVVNLWEFLSLHHEVGHDLEIDLKLRPALLLSLQSMLTRSGVPMQRVMVWQAWQAEVFADLVGLQLGGPAFGDALFNLLLLPASLVTAYNAADPHPTHYIRILMNAAYARTLVKDQHEVTQQADDIEARWIGLYGEQPQFQEFVDDFPHVFQALMGTPLEVLNGNTVRELMSFSAADDMRIRAAAGYLATGLNAPAKVTIPPRHCISAARMAVTAAVLQPSVPETSLASHLQTINERTAALVRDNAAPGLRASDMSTPHRQFIAAFAALP